MSYQTLVELLLADRSTVLLLDGGMATELESHGVELHDMLWSSYVLYTDPEKIKEVHLAYLEAGAQILTAASYQVGISAFLHVSCLLSSPESSGSSYLRRRS